MFIFLTRAASYLSEQNSTSLHQNSYFEYLAIKNHGYEDLKNCKYYFSGSFGNSSQGANYERVISTCENADYRQRMQFDSDIHVKSVMDIFKTGLYLLIKNKTCLC